MLNGHSKEFRVQQVRVVFRRAGAAISCQHCKYWCCNNIQPTAVGLRGTWRAHIQSLMYSTTKRWVCWMSRALALAVDVGKQKTLAATLRSFACQDLLTHGVCLFACFVSTTHWHTRLKMGITIWNVKGLKPANSKLKVFDSGVKSRSNSAFYILEPVQY